MSLIAEFRLQSPHAPLVDVARSVSECTITVEREDQTVSGPIVNVIRVRCASFEAFEAALDDVEYVQEFALVSNDDSVRIYHIVMKGPYPEQMDELTLNKTFIDRTKVTKDGWKMKQQFANRDELAAYRESCRKMGSQFYLERLYESNDAETVHKISDKQREALIAAYKSGYFAVPRQASLEEVATSLEISRSALAERLHRAQSHLIEHYFYDDLYLNPG